MIIPLKNQEIISLRLSYQILALPIECTKIKYNMYYKKSQVRKTRTGVMSMVARF